MWIGVRWLVGDAARNLSAVTNDGEDWRESAIKMSRQGRKVDKPERKHSWR